MPKKYFICPDNETVSIDQCLTQCRLSERCAPISYLMACADQRTWVGRPSVTQLIKGTREAWLSILKDYAVRPNDEAFALFGTGVHKALEESQPKGSITEHPLSLEIDEGIIITGTADYLQPDGDKMYTLWDYKTSGAFKVKKALGMKTRREKLINGETRTVVEYIPEDVDMKDWELQLNMYRIMAEREDPNISITNMYIFCIVRDGGMQATRQYGIENNTYTIPVKRWDDDKVLDYFRVKASRLIKHLETNTIPPVCTADECWNGRKCSRYCNVYEFCGGYNG